MSLPFLPNLLEIKLLGLFLEEPFKGLEDNDDKLILLKELVECLKGELLEDLNEYFLLGFPLFSKLLDLR